MTALHSSPGATMLHGATMLAQVVGGTWTQCDNVDAASDSIVAPGYSYVPLPFITWNLFGWRGYLGAKVYGADAPEYKFWMNPDDVYEGSQVIQFSGRLGIND